MEIMQDEFCVQESFLSMKQNGGNIFLPFWIWGFSFPYRRRGLVEACGTNSALSLKDDHWAIEFENLRCGHIGIDSVEDLEEVENVSS